MEGFTYENQGAETMLVYHLGESEHLDHFAKGMLQGNEMAGILRPSFMQKDMDQYLKFPVTSRIPLKEFQRGEMERETVLHLCLSIAGAVQEIEEYMLSPEKLLLDPEYIFVDVRKKEASLLYLPVDEISQKISLKEFLLQMLSHTRYQLDQDVSYVARLIHFLNGSKAEDYQELQRLIQNLMSSKEESLVNKTTASETVPVSSAPSPSSMKTPASFPSPAAPVPSTAPTLTAAKVPLTAPTPSAVPVPPAFSVPPVPTGGFNPIAQDLEPQKEKGFFAKKEKKVKEVKKPEIKVPNMQIPGAGVPNMQIPRQTQPEVVLKVDEQGKYLADQASPDAKKKSGLFSFGKKKKEEKSAVPPLGMPGNIPESNSLPKPPMQGMPMVQVQSTPIPSVQSTSIPSVQSTPVPQPYQQQAQEGSTVYIGHGNSDDDNRTVIMGGGKDYGSTMILGAGNDKTARVTHHVVKITRRRTGQSMVINKDIFRIGSEAGFVDFFIGDNPAIGSCHADIFEDGGAYYITDRNSLNHTYVGGIMAQPMQSVQLNNGTVIRLADEDFDFIIS